MAFWHEGAHRGGCKERAFVHTVKTSTGKVHDAKLTDALIRADDRAVFADKAYVSDVRKRAARARGIYWAVKECEACLLYKRKPKRVLSTSQKKRNRKHGCVRAKVEHVFKVMKCQFGYRKVRYKGLAKNPAHIFSLMALANLYMARKRLRAR